MTAHIKFDFKIMDNDPKKTLSEIKERLEAAGTGEIKTLFALLGRLNTLCGGLPFLSDDQKQMLSELVDNLPGFKSVDDRVLSLAIHELITQLESCLSDNSDSPREDFSVSIPFIESAFVSKSEDELPGTANCEKGLVLLNEAASRLIELHVDDANSIKKIKAMIAGISKMDCITPKIGALLQKTNEKFAGLLSKDSENRIEDILKIGQYMDSALDLMEDQVIGVCTLDENPKLAAKPEKPESEQKKEPEFPGAKAPAEPAPAPPIAPTVINIEADEELIAAFINESRDLIAIAEKALLNLEKNPENKNALDQVFRSYHSIKGTSGFLNFTPMTRLCHGAESLLSAVRKGKIPYTSDLADLALQGIDMARSLTDQFERGCEVLPPDGYEQLVKRFEGIKTDSAEKESMPVPETGAPDGKTLETPAPEKETQSDKATKLQEDETSDDTLPQTENTCKLPERLFSMESSIRVGTQRLDRMIEMVGELVVAHSMVSQDKCLEKEENIELLNKIQHTSKIVRELQHFGMLMRMVPLKATFQKMTRLVRDLAKKTGKQVRLVTEGEDTEIDRNMVDIVNVPLVHMVRNAVDHGIEPARERIKAGKSETGTIRLTASHGAGSVLIEIHDDGRGLDKEKILTEAQKQNLIPPDRQLTDEQLFDLIFHPGLSTAAALTDVSGRGVGMDAVRGNIEALNGHIEIQSQAGLGSTFKMSLPLTLAIIDGMVVRVGSKRYVLPTISIVKSLKPEPGQLRSVYKQGKMLTIFNKLVPLFDLGRLFENEEAGAENDPDNQLVMVIEYEQKLAGLIIDELVGRQQIVIKSLGETMRDIPGISGGAIMPDGRVGLILDIGGIVKLANR